jgi:hypothetical protein
VSAEGYFKSAIGGKNVSFQILDLCFQSSDILFQAGSTNNFNHFYDFGFHISFGID